MTIVHRTYTEFDLRAITVNGLSVKPDADKRPAIGKFGTGLKYALSVLLREGCSVTILTPGHRHKVVLRASEFRGQPYEALMLRTFRTGPAGPGKAKRTDLPFTSHYGSNWEMWMAFREIESNTRDEGGWTKLFNGTLPDEFKHISDGCAILIEGEAYETEFYRMGQTFLNPDGPPRLDVGGVRIYDRPHEDYLNENKYYRGLRAGKMEGDTQSLFIYDATGDIHLTEERQVSDYYWNWRVTSAIASCDDEKLIRAVLEAEDEFWESKLEFHPSMPASETFMRVAAVAKVKARHSEYIKSKKPESIKQLSVDKYPTPWHMSSYAILSASDAVVARRPDDMSEAVFKGIWMDRVAAINTHAPTAFNVEEAAEDVQEAPAGPEAGEGAGEGSTGPGAAPDGEAEGGEKPVFLTEEVGYLFTEEECPGHVASKTDVKVCGRCGAHIDSLRPPEDDMPF